MRVLSLFDGMGCGMLAMQSAGIAVERYVAFEIDKYAVSTSAHNFPMIEHRGDVFKADFTEFAGFDFLVGGSPCTYWSIAQKNNRETEASGMGWELFSQYVRALNEAKPRLFIYENNKSMSNAIRESITETFGFEPICINSALVSAQNRNRLYWVGMRNADGTYSKVRVEQPTDRRILLKDILDNAETWLDKSYAYTTRCQGAIIEDTLVKHRHTMAAEPVRGMADNTKCRTLTANYWKTNVRDAFVECAGGRTMTAEPVCVGAKTGLYAIPCDDKRPIKSVSSADGKEYTVYEVKNGQITIKDKQYQIKLADGFYIIRKLTVRECKRLQTVPEWYEFPVSDSQAYKMLGNGWTVEVISHILRCMMGENVKL